MNPEISSVVLPQSSPDRSQAGGGTHAIRRAWTERQGLIPADAWATPGGLRSANPYSEVAKNDPMRLDPCHARRRAGGGAGSFRSLPYRRRRLSRRHLCRAHHRRSRRCLCCRGACRPLRGDNRQRTSRWPPRQRQCRDRGRSLCRGCRRHASRTRRRRRYPHRIRHQHSLGGRRGPTGGWCTSARRGADWGHRAPRGPKRRDQRCDRRRHRRGRR